MANRGPGPVPNRWLHCPRKSETIIHERFLAFKTPLSMDFKNQMPLQCIFTPEMIFDYCKTLKLKLGLWVDLTNTKRFYDRTVVEQRGAQYIKLQCRGHAETPSHEQTQAFIQFVDDFINEHPFDLVGIHCTHGFNRTGFLIASYLVERLDFSVEVALAIFAKARPPGIYKQDYINELFRRYESEEVAIQAPELPAWCFDYDDSDREPVTGQKRTYDEARGSASMADLNADADDLEDNDNPEAEEADNSEAKNGEGFRPKKKRCREKIRTNAKFMDGVPGVTLVIDQPRLCNIQWQVQDMCSWSKSGFPGAQPVSMDRTNLQKLHHVPYKVSWKADGMRYMMLIKKRNEVYFIDRNNSVFEVDNLTFPCANNLHEHLTDTLLDGEMVLDKHQGTIIPRFLIYDIVQLNGHDVGRKRFDPDRYDIIRKHIIEPRHRGIRQGIFNRDAEPFSVRNKEFWDITQSATLLGEKFAKQLSHEPDGLIFQPALEPYKSGVNDDVFKWKPCDMNSIDFLLKIETESGLGMLRKKIGRLFVGGHDAPFDNIDVSKKNLKEYDNKIIECSFNPKTGWEFMRERTDKTMPNSYKTAKAVCESIRFPVTKPYLLDFIASYGYRDEKIDRRSMPPPRQGSSAHQQQQQQHHQQQRHQQHQHQQQQHNHQQQQQHHHQQQQHHQQHQHQQQHHQPEQQMHQQPEHNHEEQLQEEHQENEQY